MKTFYGNTLFEHVGTMLILYLSFMQFYSINVYQISRVKNRKYLRYQEWFIAKFICQASHNNAGKVSRRNLRMPFFVRNTHLIPWKRVLLLRNRALAKKIVEIAYFCIEDFVCI